MPAPPTRPDPPRRPPLVPPRRPKQVPPRPAPPAKPWRYEAESERRAGPDDAVGSATVKVEAVDAAGIKHIRGPLVREDVVAPTRPGPISFRVDLGAEVAVGAIATVSVKVGLTMPSEMHEVLLGEAYDWARRWVADRANAEIDSAMEWGQELIQRRRIERHGRSKG